MAFEQVDAGPENSAVATLLFVYGTLKRGMSNHHRLAGQHLVGEARTQPVYRLYRIDWYPGLVRVITDGVTVEGELWEVDDATLRQLDEYEGVPTWFERCELEIDGVDKPVQGYLYRGDVSSHADIGTCWTE